MRISPIDVAALPRPPRPPKPARHQRRCAPHNTPFEKAHRLLEQSSLLLLVASDLEVLAALDGLHTNGLAFLWCAAEKRRTCVRTKTSLSSIRDDLSRSVSSTRTNGRDGRDGASAKTRDSQENPPPPASPRVPSASRPPNQLARPKLSLSLSDMIKVVVVVVVVFVSHAVRLCVCFLPDTPA